MRRDGFLRTPIRSEHQDRIQNIQVNDVALAGNPDPTTPYPQTLELSFETIDTTMEVQIALPWEGSLQFVPDSMVNHPRIVSEVSRAQFPGWSVSGDLVLKSYMSFLGSSGLAEGFAAHLSLIDPVPSMVRFSKVRLSEDFLFTTLRDLPKHRFVFEGAEVSLDDPLRLEKLIIKFLNGKAYLPCPIHPNDPTQDATLLPMPVVDLAPAGTRTVLRVTMASSSEEELSTSWFSYRPEIDAISGELLVPPAVDNFTDQAQNLVHPNYSVIPARMIFQTALAAAYAPDHGSATPVRTVLSMLLSVGESYRKIEFLRPPIPGRPVGVVPYRPYPMYQLCWRPTAGGAIMSIRMPISGRVYLPFTSDTFTFWVIPRSADPNVIGVGDHVRLSTQAPAPARYIGLPNTTLDFPLGASSSARIYVHLQEYDSRLAWEGFGRIAPNRRPLQETARRDWNLPYVGCPPGNIQGICDWFILPTTAAREDYRQLYGYFRESAGRHGISPEFLQVVFFGEGGGEAITGGFNPAESLDTFGFVGLDLVLYRTGCLPVGAPAVPPEATTEGDAAEIAEYTFNLVTQGYVDPIVTAALSFDRVVVRQEAGFTRTLQSGRVAGWRAAIELVAAELHARLDEMMSYLAAKVPPPPVVEENQRRFLAYVRFNSRPRTARGHADNMSARLRRWSGALPASNENVLFNTIQRIAVTQWHDKAGVYRSIE